MVWSRTVQINRLFVELYIHVYVYAMFFRGVPLQQQKRYMLVNLC